MIFERGYPETKKEENGADDGGSKSKIGCFYSSKCIGIVDALPIKESVSAVRPALLYFGWR